RSGIDDRRKTGDERREGLRITIHESRITKEGGGAMQRSTRLAAALVAVLAAAPAAWAQSYPTRPVRLVLPFPPGGPTDITGRAIAQKLQEQLGQPVVPENRPGAAGNIGLEIGAKAPPDGYTITLTAPPIAVSPSLYRKLNYNAERDFAPVTL